MHTIHCLGHRLRILFSATYPPSRCGGGCPTLQGVSTTSKQGISNTRNTQHTRQHYWTQRHQSIRRGLHDPNRRLDAAAIASASRLSVYLPRRRVFSRGAATARWDGWWCRCQDARQRRRRRCMSMRRTPTECPQHQHQFNITINISINTSISPSTSAPPAGVAAGAHTKN